MRIVTAALSLALTAQPLMAETGAPQPAPADPSAKEGMGLIEEGARIILRSLLDDVEPKMRELQDGLGQALAEMGPALKELLLKIDDFRNYHPPEMLPNGDIIIRRRTPSELTAPDGQIEL